MEVYLIEDTDNAPGRIYGIFADLDAAIDYMQHLEHLGLINGAQVVTRKVHYGQQSPASAGRFGMLP